MLSPAIRWRHECAHANANTAEDEGRALLFVTFETKWLPLQGQIKKGNGELGVEGARQHNVEGGERWVGRARARRRQGDLYLEPEEELHLTPCIFARVFARDEAEGFEVFVCH